MASFAPIYNPTVPFQSAILGGINEGKRVSIQGQARNQAKRFAINFVCFNNDIAFHFNPRFDEGNVIVCNTMQRNSWGSEERKSRMPFQRNTFFDIGITVLGHAFQVTVNGQFTLEYRHRVSYQTIQSLEVKGDVNLTCVTFSGSEQSLPPPPPYSITPSFCMSAFAPPTSMAAGPVSIHNPPMPFMAALQGTFMQNRSIIIVGFVSYGADKFGVDLLNSATRDIYLHINPRFREGALVRNTKDRGNWGPEERHVSYMPFTQGQSFQMEIRNEGGCFGVYVGGAKVFTYVHRLPVTQIDRIEVGGDVTLSYVQF
ncbi:galectin-4-like isoform X2 [Spea bombifrons]|uniref:galectin-4-like isoform X2 n=1 Tax=Spea bombifrons TaxID=233779 RepID=UPI00234BE60B|nr:galectin-4-like isoform X2 [Spea bombifrons]